MEKIYCEGCGICQDNDGIEFTLENPDATDQDSCIDGGYNYYCSACSSEFT